MDLGVIFSDLTEVPDFVTFPTVIFIRSRI